ncbi:uncharacterized protein LOC105188151 [Harpegnathos saltator]|uniref:uncharacterized protein LOC105188151 n=1 Tax=Harpegnathos saltator TaxID=610380 RepID=UPI000DBEDC1B|nr:uncharacterized protein LOC105188151 [Harpegnathos saltator]
MEVAWWQGVTKPASDWTKGQSSSVDFLQSLLSYSDVHISERSGEPSRVVILCDNTEHSRIATPVTNMFPDDSKMKFVPLAAYSTVTRRTSSMHVKSDILKRPDELSVRKYETYANSSAKYQFTDYDEIELVREDVIYAASFYYIIKRPVADKERASKHKISFKQEADVGLEVTVTFATCNVRKYHDISDSPKTDDMEEQYASLVQELHNLMETDDEYVADKERASKHKISFKQEADVGQECPLYGFSTGNELFVDLEN